MLSDAVVFSRENPPASIVGSPETITDVGVAIEASLPQSYPGIGNQNAMSNCAILTKTM